MGDTLHKRSTYVIALTAVLTTFGAGSVAWAAQQDETTICPTRNSTITQETFEDLASGDECSLTAAVVKLDNDQFVTVPEPDLEVIQSYASNSADGPKDIISYQDADGAVAIDVEGEVLGDPGAIPESSDSSTGDATTNVVTTGRCSGDALEDWRTYGNKWSGTYKWWYNDNNSAGSGSLDRIKAGMQAWLTPATKCPVIRNNASVAYQPGGSDANYPVYVNADGSCHSGPSGHSTVGWGRITKSGTLAVTCSYVRPGTQVRLEADVLFDTDATWWRSESGSGCSTQTDLQYTATHEFGHALGLNHSTSSYNQTMQPSQPPCFTGARNLGEGDMAGMEEVYPY